MLDRYETADESLAGYAERLSDPLLERQLRGYLTGSLDVVLRVGHGGDALPGGRLQVEPIGCPGGTAGGRSIPP